MTEDALKIRRTAKTKFTRKKNEFYGALARKEPFDAIQGKFKQLTDAWHTVEGKHDLYITCLEEEAQENAEPWLTELQDIYEEAFSIYNKCVSENALRIREEEMRRKYDLLNKRKRTLDVMFQNKLASMENLLNEKDKKLYVAAFRSNHHDLKILFQDCKSIHDEMITLPLEQRHTENEIEWLRNIHAQYNGICDQLESIIGYQETRARARESNPLQMEKVKMHVFGGNVREYPQFKVDFTKHVMPAYNEDSIPYVLRSCLRQGPQEYLKSVDDDIEEMWARLDEKYGDNHRCYYSCKYKTSELSGTAREENLWNLLIS